VRVALDPAELVDHPLRVGLSMKATIDLHDTSGPLVAKQVRDTPRKLVPGEGREEEIERQIAAVIASNGGARGAAGGAH
jgi:membrane fusion protein (multidrug efflux system)